MEAFKELGKETASSKEELPGRTVEMLLSSTFIVLTGKWEWELHTEQIFCSDDFLHVTDSNPVTRVILHPDDKEKLTRVVFTEVNFVDKLEFRVITSYGEIKILKGTGLAITINEKGFDNIQRESFQQILSEQELRHLDVMKEMYARAERTTSTGNWYFNETTHETWYSNYIYTIYDLPPQSLNARLDTFTSLIHPEDQDQVTNFINRAFQLHLPIQLEYRIRTAQKEKYVRYHSYWFFNSKGEHILCGTLQDITEYRAVEQAQESAASEAAFNRQIIYSDEQYAGIGHWSINLLTRKTQYSENFFRIYGLKNKSLPPSIHAFINFVHPEDREKLNESFQKLLDEHIQPNLEYRIIRADGKLCYISQKARLVTLGNELVMTGTIQDMTATKLLEKKLELLSQEAADKNFAFRQAEELTGMGSWTWDLTNGEINWSEGFHKLLGFRNQAGELSLKKFTLLVHTEDQQLLDQEIKKILKTKLESRFVLRLHLKGEVKCLNTVFSIIIYNQKEIFVAIFQDVTIDLKREIELKHKLHLTEQLGESLRDRVLITDSSHNIIFWNRQCEEDYKLPAGEVLGKNFFDIFPGLKSEEELRNFNRVMKGESLTQPGRKSSKAKGFFDLYLTPYWNPAKSEIQGIIHIMHDNSKHTDEVRTLKERIEILENLTEYSDNCLIVLDREMNYLLWNKKCEIMFGLKKEQVIGKHLLDVFPGSQNLPGYKEMNRVWKGENLIFSPVRSRDDEKYQEIRLTPIRNEAGEVLAILWRIRDLEIEI